MKITFVIKKPNDNHIMHTFDDVQVIPRINETVILKDTAYNVEDVQHKINRNRFCQEIHEIEVWLDVY